MAEVAPRSAAATALRRIAALPVQVLLYLASGAVLTALTVAAAGVWLSAVIGRRR